MAGLVPRPDKSTPIVDSDQKSALQSWFDFFGYVEAQIKFAAASIVSILATIAGYESAWTAWTPTVSASSGTFTTLGTVTARYKQIGKTVFFYITIPITTNGTAAGFVQATLPIAAANTTTQSAQGRDTGLTGKQLSARILQNTTTMQVTFYDATYPGANGAAISMSGTYETT